MAINFRNKYKKFFIVAIIYCLWVLWLNNYFFFIGLIVIFDAFITKKINWTFWKRKLGLSKKENLFTDYIDALIIAIVGASAIRLFLIEIYTIPTPSMEKTLLVGDYVLVSKFTYGPKMPNTPISIPFTHNTLPFNTQKKSYVEWIKRPYKRLAGISKIKRDDIMVFHFPEGDTIILQYPEKNYYAMKRKYGGDRFIEEKYDLIARPVDKRDNYIKRCIALPSDTMEIHSGKIYVNHKLMQEKHNAILEYIVETDGEKTSVDIIQALNADMFEKKIRRLDNSRFVIPLTKNEVKQLNEQDFIVSVNRYENPVKTAYKSVFPYDYEYPWTENNFGPVVIPKKGNNVKLTLKNLSLYRRIIENYENNELFVKEDTIYINGKRQNFYTFKMNYYFVVGDNRPNSADSRYWGFVPEDHIVGKALFIIFSKDINDKYYKIRWKRILSKVK
ncbi:MAG: signal peptidase I [Bacteroidales bacterium]|nr:signal peptidase I [Bacteroidales bacterium]